MLPLQDSTSDLDDGPRLATRAAADGYLYFPGLLPATEVLELRAAMLPDLADLGWIIDHTGRANLNKFVDDTDAQVGELVCRHGVLPPTLSLQHHPRLIDLFTRLYGEAVLPLPRVLMRYNFPRRDQHTTPQHQDFPHVQGTARVFTAWIPLGDCVGDMGGLKIAAGSNHLGALPLHPAMGAGGMAVPGDFSGQWHGSDMRAGDVLLFNCLTVHAGRTNNSDLIRLSVDMRYQPRAEPVTEEWLHPHRRQFSWPELYAAHPGSPHHYYWRKYQLRTVPYDDSYYAARDRMGLQMAAAGDWRAEATLRRIVGRGTDPEQRAQAIEALRLLAASDEESAPGNE